MQSRASESNVSSDLSSVCRNLEDRIEEAEDSYDELVEVYSRLASALASHPDAEVEENYFSTPTVELGSDCAKRILEPGQEPAIYDEFIEARRRVRENIEDVEELKEELNQRLEEENGNRISPDNTSKTSGVEAPDGLLRYQELKDSFDRIEEEYVLLEADLDYRPPSTELKNAIDRAYQDIDRGLERARAEDPTDVIDDELARPKQEDGAAETGNKENCEKRDLNQRIEEVFGEATPTW